MGSASKNKTRRLGLCRILSLILALISLVKFTITLLNSQMGAYFWASAHLISNLPGLRYEFRKLDQALTQSAYGMHLTSVRPSKQASVGVFQ